MHRRFSSRTENGFTLIEVVVSISLLLVVALAAGAFAMQGLQLSTQQQRMQIAVTVATERMEQVQRYTGSNAEPSALVLGRGSAAVTAAWSANSGVEGVAQTYPLSATTAGVETIPITLTTTRSGSDYVSTTLIGTCYQPKTGGACTTIAGKSTDAAASSVAGYTRVLRVIVTVTFPGACGATPCRYTSSALFDTHQDLTWQTF